MAAEQYARDVQHEVERQRSDADDRWPKRRTSRIVFWLVVLGFILGIAGYLLLNR
jgi:hypothetical protein